MHSVALMNLMCVCLHALQQDSRLTHSELADRVFYRHHSASAASNGWRIGRDCAIRGAFIAHAYRLLVCWRSFMYRSKSMANSCGRSSSNGRKRATGAGMLREPWGF